MDLCKLLDEIEAVLNSGGDPGRTTLDVRLIIERTRGAELPDVPALHVRESLAREERDRENEARGVSRAEAQREEVAAKETVREAGMRARGEMAPLPEPVVAAPALVEEPGDQIALEHVEPAAPETPAETIARLETELAPEPEPAPPAEPPPPAATGGPPVEPPELEVDPGEPLPIEAEPAPVEPPAPVAEGDEPA